MTLTEPPSQLVEHPLAGLSPDQRDTTRAQAFGRVLAAIALRETGGRPDQPPDRTEPSPRTATPKPNRVPHPGE